MKKVQIKDYWKKNTHIHTDVALMGQQRTKKKGEENRGSWEQ